VLVGVKSVERCVIEMGYPDLGPKPLLIEIVEESEV